uniref:EF-hand domain-containing protein n=1 Tax=Triticum urartu TaxID=4572 RepID=A0A8R7QME9_TRIUA
PCRSSISVDHLQVAEAFRAFDGGNGGCISTAQLVRSMVPLQVAGGMVYAHKAKLFHRTRIPRTLMWCESFRDDTIDPTVSFGMHFGVDS